jgi:hypothetical protein
MYPLQRGKVLKVWWVDVGPRVNLFPIFGQLADGRQIFFLHYAHHRSSMAGPYVPLFFFNDNDQGIDLFLEHRTSLYLDPSIRDWVLFPISLVMVRLRVSSRVSFVNHMCFLAPDFGWRPAALCTTVTPEQTKAANTTTDS